MTRHLYVWADDKPIGRFELASDGCVGFVYEPSAEVPISLSLPLGGGWAESAPMNFLEGLLPDGRPQRHRMMRALGSPTDHPFDLLDAVDVAGGLVFTTDDRPPSNAVAEVSIMTESDVEAQMQRVWDTGDSWWEEQGRSKFSLTGSQGKFSVTIRGGRWYWPAAGNPSTHILKPGGKETPKAPEVEHATMTIARAVGIPTPEVSLVRCGTRVGYLVERFDRRRDEHGVIRRIHTEDLAQALGITTQDKYEPGIRDVTDVLRRSGACEDTLYEWLRMVAYNHAVGNWDAHAKNYGIYLTKSGPELCPLYDALSMCHWERFRYDTTAMGVNEIYDAWEVTLDDWKREAEACGLDPYRVVEDVTDIEESLLDVDYHSLNTDTEIALEIADFVRVCGRDLIPSIGIDAAKAPHGTESQGAKRMGRNH